MRYQHEDGYDYADEAERRAEFYALSPEAEQDQHDDWVMDR